MEKGRESGVESSGRARQHPGSDWWVGGVEGVG